MNSYSFAFACGLIDMVIYGLVPTGVKLFMQPYDPLLFSGLATFIGGVPLLIFLIYTKRQHELYLGTHRKQLLTVAFLTALASGLFFVGATLTSAMNTGLLEQVEPIYAMILAVLTLKEHISKLQVLATLLMVGGAVSIAYHGHSSINPGDALILIAPFLFQVSHLCAKRVLQSTGHVLVVAAARLLYGGIMIFFAGCLLNPDSLKQLLLPEMWAAAILFGLIFRTLDLVLWYTALKQVPLALLSALLPLGAGVAFLAAIFVVGEVATSQHYIGLTLILSGLALLTRVKSQKNCA